jgi:hypothetical protein
MMLDSDTTSTDPTANCSVAVVEPPLFVAFTTYEVFGVAAVGVPEMAPDVVSSVSPAGNGGVTL